MKNPKPQSDRRQHLVNTALRLFRDHGYHATGIDTILAESGVAKRTLYLHFASKDELIVAALAQRDADWRDWFRDAIKKRATTPRDRLLAIFDALEEWFTRADFHGCMFINASAEFQKLADPIHREAIRHQQLVGQYVADLAEAAGASDPAALATALTLLIEGAIVTAQIHGNPAAAQQAKSAAAALLTHHLPRAK